MQLTKVIMMKDCSTLIDMSEIQEHTNIHLVISKVIAPTEFNNIRAVSLAGIITDDLNCLQQLPNLTLLNLRQA